MISHAQIPPGAATPFNLQVPFSGNLQVLSFLGGFETITSISSTPSCTWLSTGPAHYSGSPNNYTQIYYAMNCTGNAVAINLKLNGSADGDTLMTYDITGPNAGPLTPTQAARTRTRLATYPTSQRAAVVILQRLRPESSLRILVKINVLRLA